MLLSQRVICQPKIIDTQFAIKPFGKEITTKNVQAFFPKTTNVESKLVLNNHSGNEDTLTSYWYNKSSISFLKTKEREFLTKASIDDYEIVIGKGIFVGMSLSDFFRKFKYTARVDNVSYVIVTDLSEYNYHTFFFENGKLARILIDCTPD